jgi:hypothetical protein
MASDAGVTTGQRPTRTTGSGRARGSLVRERNEPMTQNGRKKQATDRRKGEKQWRFYVGAGDAIAPPNIRVAPQIFRCLNSLHMMMGPWMQFLREISWAGAIAPPKHLGLEPPLVKNNTKTERALGGRPPAGSGRI